MFRYLLGVFVVSIYCQYCIAIWYSIITALMLHAGKYALVDMLPIDQQKAIFSLFDAANALWRWEYKEEDIPALKTQVAQALTLVEMFLPVSEMDMKLHIWLHLADTIASAGPLHYVCCFLWERLYGLWGSWILNRKTPEMNLARTFAGYMAASSARGSSNGSSGVLSREYDISVMPVSYNPYATYEPHTTSNSVKVTLTDR